MNNDGLQMFSEIFLFFFFFGLYGSLSASNIFPVGGKRIRASEFSLRKKARHYGKSRSNYEGIFKYVTISYYIYFVECICSSLSTMTVTKY